jgi:hypothetical protein
MSLRAKRERSPTVAAILDREDAVRYDGHGAPTAESSAAVDKVFADVVVVGEIFYQLRWLPDVVALARCNKTLYRHLDTCYPELERALRCKSPPGLHVRAHLQLMMRQLVSGIVTPLVWHWVCVSVMDPSQGRDFSNTLAMDARSLQLVEVLIDMHRLDLLSQFMGMVTAWQRCVELTWERNHYVIPELQWVWACIASSACANGDDDLLDKAMKQVNTYVEHPEMYDENWHRAAQPRAWTRSERRRHDDYYRRHAYADWGPENAEPSISLGMRVWECYCVWHKGPLREWLLSFCKTPQTEEKLIDHLTSVENTAIAPIVVHAPAVWIL